MRAQPNPRVQVKGTGSCLGERVIDNAALEHLVHGYDAARSGPFSTWVDQVTHIHERRYAKDGQRTCDLALVAARQALETAQVRPKDLDFVFYASFTPSQVIPGDHCILLHDLGADGCPTFNLMAACAGSLYGMGLGYGMLASGHAKHVLVVATETISHVVNYHDPLTAILFGDGAGAVVLSRVEGADPTTGMLPPFLASEYSADTIRVRSSNNPQEVRCFPPRPENPGIRLVEQSVIEMAGGPRVLRNAVHAMADCACRVLGYAPEDLKAEDPGLRATLDAARLVPHQANGRIVDGLAERLRMPQERVVRTLYRFGNISAASSLIALDFAFREGTMERVLDAQERVLEVRTVPDRIRPGELVVMPGIGGGYLMGCIAFRTGETPASPA